MSAEERRQLLEAYRNLRVTDVCDGMDWTMHFDLGLVDSAIRPLWRTRVCGIAKTVRYVPTRTRIPTMTPEEYDAYSSNWYATICTYPFGDLIEPGDLLVFDCGGLDVGLLGSNNTLAYKNKGAVAMVTDGGVRDTDEVILEKVPVWSRHISRTMVQGRLEFADMMKPITCGGVPVHPGDMVVADGDGVIVVPRKIAMDVAKWARREHDNDNQARRSLYEQAGLPEDETLD
ncbi:MAG: RraA family protein [Armatimonadetes bacterium]|nr:RraA family protein [Armatimonadota bacterium]